MERKSRFPASYSPISVTGSPKLTFHHADIKKNNTCRNKRTSLIRGSSTSKKYRCRHLIDYFNPSPQTSFKYVQNDFILNTGSSGIMCGVHRLLSGINQET